MTNDAAPSNAELAARMQKIIFTIEDIREDIRETDRAIESTSEHYSEVVDVLDRVFTAVDRQTNKLNEVVARLNEMTNAFGKLVKALERPR